MTTLHISLLGPLTVTIDNRPAAFRTDAERALLAYLAMHQGVPQRRDTLAGLLSPERGDSSALTYLRNRLARLRRALSDDAATPSWFDIDRKQMALRTGADIVVDAPRFARLLAAVESHPHRQLAGCPTCLARLEEAVHLVRGELLAGLNFPSEPWEAWVLAQREYMHQRALAAMTLLRQARVARSEWAAVLTVAQQQLTLEPWLEAAHRALMQAHAQLGDRNAALAQYEQCAQLLRDELGVEPEEETTALCEKLKDEGADAPPANPAPSHVEGRHSPLATRHPLPATRNSLPLQTSRFFGRETEQTHLLERLVDPNYRLMTLVGTGGIGKTRLAIEVGQQVKQSFPDGVWFVALDVVQGGSEQIKIAVGEVLGLAQDDKQLTGDQVLAILRHKQMLLILDNCETVLDELGFIPSWLNRAPQVAILATAREPLNFQAESVMLLEGLPVGETPSQPPPIRGRSSDLVNERSIPSPHGGGLGRGLVSGPAEAMFAEQAQRARGEFAVTAENLGQVRRICELVDGLPLGIALAAAWVRRRSLAQIIDAIGQSLDFLSTRLRDGDPRHRSMRAVFEASWQLLAAEEQAVLAALSVFPTSFTAEAAERVAGAALFDLDLLCEKSLLQQQHEAERYFMHSLLRQFAGDKLAERAPAVERAFVDYYFDWAREHGADHNQPEWGNFVAGITKAHALEAWPTVLDFVKFLDASWFRQARFSEMQKGLILALEAATVLGDQFTVAQTRMRLGEVEIELNDYPVAVAHLGHALDHFLHLEEGIGIAESKYLLGRIKQEQAKDDEALALFEDSKQIFEGEQNVLGIAKNLNLIAVHHIKKYGDFQTACSYLEQAAALQRQQPLSSRYIETLRYLARAKVRSNAFAAAEKHLVEAAEVSRLQNNLGEYAAVLYERVILCKRRNQIDEALAFGYACLDNFRKVGSLRWEALIKTQLGLLHQARQEYHQGLASITEGLHIFGDLDDLYEQAFSHFYLHQIYAEMGDAEQSLAAQQQAQRLSHILNDQHLQERFS